MRSKKILGAAICSVIMLAVCGTSVVSAEVLAEDETSEKTIVSRESWSTKYTVKSNPVQTGNMTCVAIVYEDGSFTVIGQNETKYNISDMNSSVDFGTIWYSDSLFSDPKFSNNFTSSNSFNSIINYDTTRIGYTIVCDRWDNVPVGKAFELTITPKKKLTEDTTIEAFGHEIRVSKGMEEVTEPTNDEKAKIAELEAKIADLEGQLNEARNNQPAVQNLGDLNNDGIVNASDAALTLIYAAYKGAGGDMELTEWLTSRDTAPADNQDPTEPATEATSPTEPATEPTEAPTELPTNEDGSVTVPFKAEVYSGNKNYTVDMSCNIKIEDDGTVMMGLYSSKEITSDEEIEIDIPSSMLYCDIPYWMERIEDFFDGTSISSFGGPVYQFENISDSLKNNSLWGRCISPDYNLTLSFGLFSADKVTIPQGHIYDFKLCEPTTTVYIDESGKRFIKSYGGEKQYLDDDVSVTLNGVTVTRHIS